MTRGINIDWPAFAKRPHFYIDLHAVYEHVYSTGPQHNDAHEFLSEVMRVRPVTSRQAAAIAIATAHALTLLR